MQRDDPAVARRTVAALITVFAVAVYAFVLFYSYRDKIAPTFSYQGLSFRQPDTWGTILSFVVTSLLAISLPNRISRTSHFIIWVVFIVAAAPAILVAQYVPVVTHAQADVLGLHVAGAMFLARFVCAQRSKRRFIPGFGQSVGPYFWLILGVLSAISYGLLIYSNGFHFRLVSLDNVYDVRSEFSTAISGVPGLAYLLPVQQNVVNPIFIARGIYGRRALALVAGIGGQLLIYASSGQKAVLFSSLAIAAAVWLFRRRGESSGNRALSAVALSAVAALTIDKVLGSILLTSLFVRRFLVVPGVLTAAYVGVFSLLPKSHFADSSFSLLPNPYAGGLNPAHIVGRAFVGNSNTSANVSLFGHGFLGAGYTGMYIEALVLGIALRLVDNACDGLPLKVSAAIFVMPSVAISSASIFTVLLTHGLIAATLLLAAAPRDGWGKKQAASGSETLSRPQLAHADRLSRSRST